MDGTNFYFLQEYLESKELLDYIQDVTINEQLVVEIVKKMILTSIYLTNRGFQFTDLKPHNVFMSNDGDTLNLKITDFDYK